MPKFNYIDDINAILLGGSVHRDAFTIESPNGDGIYEMEISPIEERSYVDAFGTRRKGFMEYDITFTFHYSSHKMELIKLLEADEIQFQVPILLDGEDPVFNTVLLNEEVVYNFFSDQPYLRDSQERKYPLGEIDLEFGLVEPKTMYEIRNIIIWDDTPVSDSGSEGVSFDSTDTSDSDPPEGELETSFTT